MYIKSYTKYPVYAFCITEGKPIGLILKDLKLKPHENV